MLVRVMILYIMLTTVAYGLHLNTFAVWELKEHLQMLYINMWELLLQLEYVTPDQRAIVYEEIQHLKQEIMAIIDQLIELDQHEHP